ncbi:MAG TPA: YkgJ family cysteine cluster protein [Pyrinomonadaceae bacterium]|jgi:Fe-S-cluster containining protein
MSQLVQITRAAKPLASVPPLTAGAEENALELAQEELRDQLAEGLMYLHSRANANTSKVLEVASFSYALIELLMERGLISVEELDARKKEVGQRLVEKFVEKGMGVALTDDEQDKYDYKSEVYVDCENRIELCRGACCRLRFALTTQDLEEGKVKWDLGRPYMIRRDADGYCHHIERGSCRCGVYENRPVVCRSYDCRRDKRIWEDFENRVVSPDLEKLFPETEPHTEESRPPVNEAVAQATPAM